MSKKTVYNGYTDYLVKSKFLYFVGYEWVELYWNLEDNDLINKFDAMLGVHIYKRYNIYNYKID